MKGKLIVIEGNDSSGKQTQAELLHKRLSEKGFPVEMIDFPQYYSGFYGKMVAKYLRGELGDVEEVNPYFSSLLYALDRLDAKNKMDDWLAKGRTIISNRYVPANMAYGSAKIHEQNKKDEFLAWLEELEYNENKIPRPDSVIFLHVPLAITQDLIRTKKKREYLEGKRKDIHEKDKSYLQRVEEMYLKLSEKNLWSRIDCAKNEEIRTIEEISEDIWNIVSKII
ncbi:MAG: deoxynucleoside kinase [Nanoarchaeota archaeon]|nr:deoxynucleoside kinase [Nanoarchaeota archaeon]